MRPLVILALAAPSLACTREKPVAPTEMTDIVRYMFANFEDDEAMAAAIDNLDPWLQDNATSEEAIDGYQLEPLSDDDVNSVDRPSGTSLSDLLGAAGGNDSAYPLEAHVDHIVKKDQLFANPKYEAYDREFIGGTPSAFRNGEAILRTVNHVETKNWSITIPYDLYKDYRWVESEETGQRAIVARSWIEDIGCSNSGDNCLRQSFSIDHFHENGNNGLLRLTATWSEVEAIIPIAEDKLVKGLADGLQDTFNNTETYLDETN